MATKDRVNDLIEPDSKPSGQPSLIEVHESWLDPKEVAARGDTLPTMRPPAITLPDEELLDDDESFPDMEGVTMPQLRKLLGSFDEESLLAELSVPALEEPEEQPRPARRSSHPPRRTTTSPPARMPSQLDLSLLPVFEDLPIDARRMFLDSCREHRLATTGRFDRFDTILVTQGAVRVAHPSEVGRPVVFGPADLVTRRASTSVGAPPTIVGARPHTVVLVWQQGAVERTVALCPWFGDALAEEGDRLQTFLALARSQTRAFWRETATLSRLTRFEFRYLPPHARLQDRGTAVRSLAYVGTGEIELIDDGAVVGRVAAGDIVFGPQVLAHAPAPMLARASSAGAAVLLADTEVTAAALDGLPLLAAQLKGTS
ncbi:MAG: hypothetical protein HY898_07100 [Deltaproteobacteria bacterium]|nr:hypothetical protein [Deltaproteobacteria bacterium]